MMKKKYVCLECGKKHGEYIDGLETWHIGKCDICGEEKPLAHIRRFNYLRKYEKMQNR
jgi:DNA-directed RNA polymerase subunit RPC12/RpoP